MDRIAIFRQIFQKKMDFLDSSTHLNRLFELLPSLMGLASNKNSGYNKAKSHKQHEEDLKEAQDEKEEMDLEFERQQESTDSENQDSADQASNSSSEEEE